MALCYGKSNTWLFAVNRPLTFIKAFPKRSAFIKLTWNGSDALKIGQFLFPHYYTGLASDTQQSWSVHATRNYIGAKGTSDSYPLELVCKIRSYTVSYCGSCTTASQHAAESCRGSWHHEERTSFRRRRLTPTLLETHN